MSVGKPPPVREFLANFRVKDAAEATHTSFDGGKYCVPASFHPTLYIAYADAIERGERLALVERHRHIGPVVIDLDLRPLPGVPNDGQHLYSPADVQRFVAKLFSQVDDIVDLNASANVIDCFVLEKPVRVTNGGTVKDGLHFVLPGVVTRVETQMALRTALLPTVAAIFGGKCSGPPAATPNKRAATLNERTVSIYDERAASIYDASVIATNGWLMLGSRKVKGGEWEPHPWRVTRVFKFDPAAPGMAEVPEYSVEWLTSSPENRRALIRQLSIRNKWSESPLTALGDKRVGPLVHESREAHARRVEAEAMHSEAKARASADAADGSSAPVDDDALAALVALLSRGRAVPYHEWYMVGQCLSNVTGKSDAGLELFHAFSRRADEAPSVPAAANAGGDGDGGGDGNGDGGGYGNGDGGGYGAVYDERGCDAMWHGLTVRPANNLGMGSLCWWAKEDDPDGYRAWQAAHGRCAQDISGCLSLVPPELRVAIFDKCAAQWPEIFTDVAIDTFTLDHDDAGLCFSFGEGAGGAISRDGLVVTLADGRVLGSVLKDTPLNRSLAFMHANVPTTINEYVFNNVSTEQSQIDSRPPGTSLTLFHGPSPFVSINCQGRQARVAVREKVSSLSKMLETALLDHARNTLGEPAANAIFFVNNGIVNNGTIVAKSSKEDTRHTDVELAALVVASDDELATRFRHVPDMVRNSSASGLYLCDPTTNVWKRKSAIEMENVILAAVRKASGAQPEDLRYVENKGGAAHVLHALARNYVDCGLVDRLDENLDVFAVTNGVFDMKARTFRTARPEDYVRTTADWAYSPEEGRLHRASVEAFIEKVLPVREERMACLRFISSLMSGRRFMKKFMVMTDRRDGNNGKSTLIGFFKAFFASYTANKGTSFMLKAAFQRDRNDHDGALQNLKGKRLILGDEFDSSNTLDCGFLKRWTGGPHESVGGRRMGDAEEFSFTWQAGFVLVFNEGRAPKFDADDGALLERFMAVPARSKFVPGDVPADAEPYTHVLDLHVTESFRSWCSALADILVELYNADDRLSDLPASMRQWRAGIADERNPLAEWLDEALEVTGDGNDRVLFGRDVINAHCDLAPYHGFNSHVKAYFRARGLVFKSKWPVPGDRNSSLCNVGFGVRWGPNAPHGVLQTQDPLAP